MFLSKVQLYEGDEFVYWRKADGLKEKLALLDRIPESAIDRAAQTLLDLRESWEWATLEERKDLVQMMIQQIGCDVRAKRILWVKTRPDFEILFQLLEGLCLDSERRYWIERTGAQRNNMDMEKGKGQIQTEVEIFSTMSNNALTTVKEDVQ